jgi:hypothetical protein
MAATMQIPKHLGQADFCRMLRTQSVIGDRSIPLGYPATQARHTIEAGITIQEHYRRLHLRGEFGRFFPLHRLARFEARHA